MIFYSFIYFFVRGGGMGWWDRADFVQRRHHGFHDIFRLAFNPADFIVIAFTEDWPKIAALILCLF